jgi:predicted O-methyltransferase YrrM
VFRRLRNNTRASTDAETTPDPLIAALAPEIHRLSRLEAPRRVERAGEVGTCVGISGAYLAAALQTNGGGALRSLEGHRDRVDIARQTWSRLGFSDAEVVVGRFEQTLDEVLAGEPFDLVFIDGNHDRDATLAYATSFAAASRPGAVMVLDDITWSDGMQQAWAELRAGLDGSVTSDLGRLGLVVLGPTDAGRR